MGLFFHQFDAQTHKHGTQYWQEESYFPFPYIMQGQFIELNPLKPNRLSFQFSLTNQKILLTTHRQVRSLELCLTAIEEHFYLQNGKKVYEIRLTKNDILTTIFTHDERIFIQFYTYMAKYCILKNFDKHFKVSKQLGTGSFSVVYEGKSIYSNSLVALKVFDKKKLLQIQDGVNILKNQIVNLEKLKQFNLSPLIEAYETQDCVILVLKKAECGHMIDYIKQHCQEYDQKMAPNIMTKVFQNLHALHSAGFIHRDIKPQNILFDTHMNSFHLFLADFGLSVQKNSPRNVIGKKCSGTIGFVAPEVLHENQYDQKCDIFSAGCLLYFLITGKDLFANLSIDDISELTFQNDYIHRKLNKLPRNLSDAKQLLKSLLQVNPSLRISALDALNHPFLSHGNDRSEQMVSKLYGQTIDQTAREYIVKKVNNFWK